MIARVLTEVVESLGILENCTCPLSKSQELIQLPIHESFWNMMTLECSLEFIPSGNVISWEHAKVVIPPRRAEPRSCCAAKRALFCSEHGARSRENLDSIVRIQASASSGSSVLLNRGG